MSNRFEGWYFKQHSGQNMIAFIPAMHVTDGHRSGSLQVVMPERAYYIDLPDGAVTIDRRSFTIRAGASTFSPSGAMLDIEADGIRVTGRLTYTGWTPPNGDIMGPYRFVPNMECRHSVFSMAHMVEGQLTVNGQTLDFSGGRGYTEGDRGRVFPRRYVWTQADWANGGTSSVMLSAAEVHPFGRRFVGIVGFVWHEGRELRLATYRGAKLDSLSADAVSIRQGAYTLTAQLLDGATRELRAPTSGGMIRLIKERLRCRTRYILTENGRVIFDVTSDAASFESEV